MQSFTDLEVWKCGLELVREIYVLTRTFPREEQFGLTSQLRRSVTGVLLNTAEGFGRYTYPDKANKYTIARGECKETEACLLIAIAIEILTKAEVEKSLQLADRTSKLLSGLISSCKKNSQ